MKSGDLLILSRIPFMSVLYKKKSKAATIALHTSVWLIYTVVVYLITLISSPKASFTGMLLFMLPFCVTFYLVVFCLGLYKKLPLLWSVLSFFMVFAFMASIAYLYIYFFLPRAGVKVFSTTDFKTFLQEALTGYIRYFSYAAIYFYAKENIVKERQLRIEREEKSAIEKEKVEKELENAILKQHEIRDQKEKLQLEKEKLQLEYAFLRTQINPHFLHNTLNVLFSKALTLSPELADNILKLSLIMRYSLESLEYDSGKVSIQKELENLQTLLDIHAMRFGDSKIIRYSIEGEADGQMLPPLSLITVVENAFKYGDLKDPQHPLEIRIVLKPREIYFYCLNKKKKNYIPMSSMNIGMTNLSKRLDSSFKGKYKMKATDAQDFYKFELNINN